jgi:Winged helix DNA-binding domain
MGGAVRRIDVDERRARLALRHHLAPSALTAGPVDAARDLVVLHGTDPASVYLAAAARMRAPDLGAIDRAMYDERALLRVLGMRRTMFAVPVETAPVVHAACTRAVAAQERRKLVQFIEQSGLVDDAGTWLKEVEEATVAAIAARGEAFATELSEDVPLLRQQLVFGLGTRSEVSQPIVTRVLFLLAADGRIIRGRPRGSWTSSQYRWTLIDSWLPGGLPELATETARVELVRKYLAAFGPATAADIKWWTGWTAAEVKRALAEVGPAEVELDGATGLVLADDTEPVAGAEPWVALLPALDPTVMGWAGRGWYLGEHAPALFDRSGNPGPTVWCDGRIVGGWAHRKDGEVAIRLLEDIGAEAAAAVAAATARLRAQLGDVRVTPRFRTPLKRELSA